MGYCPNPECPHRLATGRTAEFVPGHLRCSDCDTPLVDSDPDAAGEEAARRPIEMVELARIPEPIFAAAIRELLDEAGIGYEIVGAGVQDLFGFGRIGTGYNFVTGPPVLRVEAARLAEARELLAELDRSSPGAWGDGESRDGTEEG